MLLLEKEVKNISQGRRNENLVSYCLVIYYQNVGTMTTTIKKRIFF
jgi:hypothetical protein